MALSLAETEVMRQRLLGDVTHELKTPLASIKGYMEGLNNHRYSSYIEPMPNAQLCWEVNKFAFYSITRS